MPLHIVRGWDTDARDGAWREAQRAGERDPDAAAYLIACLRADGDNDGDNDEADAETVDVASRQQSARLKAPKAFDPMRLIARYRKFYGGSHQHLMRMPWPTFLGYVREADIMNQEEQDAYDRATTQGRGQRIPESANEPWRSASRR